MAAEHPDHATRAADALGVTMHADGRGPEGRYVDALGQRYHLLEFGEGPPTVFLHGGGPGCTGWTDFGPCTPHFAAHRRVILVDLLQYGRSDKPAISGPMWDFHAKHLVALFDALALDRPDVVCNSWGGTQALCLAADHPERVRRLVITGSMPVFHGPMSPLLDRSRRGRIAREEYYGGDGPTREKMRALMSRFEWFDGDAIPEATIDLRYVQSLEPDEISCGQVPANRGEWQDLSGHLARITAPTLFLWGMYDAFLTPDYPLMLASRMERGNLAVVDRAGHHLQEERPAAYHAAAAAFLDQEDE
jgi:pimeloyl-ACP methyl ester carboxylesterase